MHYLLRIADFRCVDAAKKVSVCFSEFLFALIIELAHCLQVNIEEKFDFYHPSRLIVI